MTSGIQVGQTVPDFSCETFDGSTKSFGNFSLANARKDGKWTVVFFYPADFTFVCATEFQALAEKQDEIAKLGGTILTMSTDTKFVHLAWQREEKELEKVRYQMGSDPTANIARMFGVLDEKSGLSLRGTFIIAPNGQLVNSECNFYNLGRNADELVRKLKANVYLSKHSDEVCPAKWNSDGDKTIRPSEAVVGRVHQALNK